MLGIVDVRDSELFDIRCLSAFSSIFLKDNTHVK